MPRLSPGIRKTPQFKRLFAAVSWMRYSRNRIQPRKSPSLSKPIPEIPRTHRSRNPMKKRTRATLFTLLLVLAGYTALSAQELQTVRVGVYHNPPKITVYPDGTVGGFHAELLDVIATENDWEVEYVPGIWTDMLDATETGEIDIMVDVAWSEERQARFAFNAEAVILNWAVVYTAPGFRPQSFLDLADRRVALMENSIHTTGQTGFTSLATSLELNFEPVTVGDYSAAFQKVADGDADAAVVNRIFGAEFAEEFGLIRSPVIFNASSIRYALPHDGELTGHLIQQIDDTLRVLKNDNTSIYYTLVDRYFSDLVSERASVPRWIIALTAGLALIAFTMLILVSRLRAEIRIRKQTESALVETTREAESANQAKSTFLANMTHEIRTPMNAIIGYSDLLQRDSSLTEKQRRSLEAINRSGEHLLALINDVLDMARIESGRLSLELSTFDLTATVTDALNVVHAIAEKEGVQISQNVHPDNPELIQSDEQKIRQVIINLVSNAVRHSRSPRVEVETQITHTPRRRCQITVRDFGIGIPQNTQDAIFHSFDSGTNSTTAGAGLGLVISRTYARALDGDITVRSPLRDGRSGTEFCFVFTFEPASSSIVRSQTTSNAQIRMIDPSQPPISILVVDDRETNRDILKELLESAGFLVRCVESGEACLSTLESWVPHLILTDIVMPGMDGVSTVKAIRELPEPARSVRIIALTASALLEERSRILRAGADAFMFKPYREQQLLRKIGELLPVQYIYEQTGYGSAETADEHSTEIPADIAEQLATAARLGSRRTIEAVLETADVSSQIKSELKTLARTFRFQEIIRRTEES
ncbi:MAG: response regulator [Spirochaetaceae bacterium]|nr:MAG: response regulator [Spirochaetaceae bacterium]